MGRLFASFGAVTLMASSASVAAQMSAGEFLRRGEPLMARNPATLVFSSEARQMARVLGSAAQNARERLDAERAAGRPVATCLPPKGKAKIDTRELIAYLRTLSPQQRSQSFDVAFAGYIARKYPCRS